ncbi:MAG: response regulator, partial [Bdellovibrionota bacterium]
LLHARGWKVLLAEPNTDVRLLMKRALEQRGIHVDDTDHGGQVLSRIESEEYDLALIEMDFPDISGKELLKAIRRSAKSRGLPVIVLHESDRRTLDDDELRRLGADHSVGKNRGIAGIVDKVFQFLEERKSR